MGLIRDNYVCNSGIFLILMPESVTVTIAPFLSWGSIFGSTLFIREARSGPFSPSNRIHITEGAEAFSRARIV